jgi:hypothetical protein
MIIQHTAIEPTACIGAASRRLPDVSLSEEKQLVEMAASTGYNPFDNP